MFALWRQQVAQHWALERLLLRYNFKVKYALGAALGPASRRALPCSRVCDNGAPSPVCRVPAASRPSP
jgi:hypothetical protein